MPSKKQILVTVAISAALFIAYNRLPAVRRLLGGGAA